MDRYRYCTEFQFPNDSFVDPDPNSELQFSVQMKDKSRLPAWLTYHYSEFSLFGTPSEGDIGTIERERTATDQFLANDKAYATVVVRKPD